MSEFLLELYSEEIPSQLQISARNQLKQHFERFIVNAGIKYKDCIEYSSPTRLSIYVKGLPENIKIKSSETRGPKVGVDKNILEGFIESRNVSEKDLFIKEIDKGKFYFLKNKEKIFSVEDFLIDILPKAISSINWKKSMKWSSNDLIWGRPLRSIFAIFNGKKLSFNYQHIDSVDSITIEQDLVIKSKKD